ncbi:uncharacterized protein MONOS_13937 [Monocercomonoides exilis]|uniref:uncharacterized protein n=1 Tax=Monocercomonoides exilis TaxID=2049356 RepID=UPI00355A333E|nr:hypothetical protein MONOS_13937 [Monocercomonoides exilis]|eukprot:MONOS_13937.1-p1 / transcript=MONOS_13937.1 / gene=MONOS_13937 / organism=Monocercomonoides_exilis_PA203 / gene_product=unspecified product / transcript_product=unspecified product / location=Mono_scaffold00907:3515-4204(+) / protein_length=230 / sequence_SO=supercontig / SO=protein_coding / is_pseudo=false
MKKRSSRSFHTSSSHSLSGSKLRSSYGSTSGGSFISSVPFALDFRQSSFAPSVPLSSTSSSTSSSSVLSLSSAASAYINALSSSSFALPHSAPPSTRSVRMRYSSFSQSSSHPNSFDFILSSLSPRRSLNQLQYTKPMPFTRISHAGKPISEMGSYPFSSSNSYSFSSSSTSAAFTTSFSHRVSTSAASITSHALSAVVSTSTAPKQHSRLVSAAQSRQSSLFKMKRPG